nr:hypothetical protein BN993_07267 [Virgibacillus halodenitrificans]
MLENNIFRLLMFIGAVVLVGIGINMSIEHYPEIKSLIVSYFNNRVQKY